MCQWPHVPPLRGSTWGVSIPNKNHSRRPIGVVRLQIHREREPQRVHQKLDGSWLATPARNQRTK